MIKRKKQPLVRTENAHACTQWQVSATDSGGRPDFMAVKRPHEDIEQADSRTLSAGSCPWDRGLSAADARGISSNPLKVRAPDATSAHPAVGEGRLPGLRVNSAPQRHARLVLADVTAGERGPDSDDAEREAEVRAEILDSVRQLLHDETEIDCLVQLCVRLHEKNIALLERAIHRRGVAECMELLEEVLVSHLLQYVLDIWNLVHFRRSPQLRRCRHC